MKASLALGMNSVPPLAGQALGFSYPPSEFFAYGVSDYFSTSTGSAGPDNVFITSDLADDGLSNKFAGLVLADSHNTNPSVKIGKHRLDFSINVVNGNAIDFDNTNNGYPMVVAFRDPDTDPNPPHVETKRIYLGTNSLEFEIFDDSGSTPPNYLPSIFFSCRPWSKFNAILNNISLTYLD
jgi:hypothetical protein